MDREHGFVLRKPHLLFEDKSIKSVACGVWDSFIIKEKEILVCGRQKILHKKKKKKNFTQKK